MTTQRKNLRVVFLDVGLNAKNGINWEAPMRARLNLPELPYFYLIDPDGKVTMSGRPAQDTVEAWFPH